MNLRLLSLLCVAYVVLIFYASLMPFDLSAEGTQIGEHFERAWQSWPFGREYRTSRADLLSNLVLYVPLGAMLAGRWAGGGPLRALAAALGATVIGSCISACVEAAQLLSFERITSAQDWVMNTAGAGLGAVWGAAIGRSAWAAATGLLRRWHAERPTALLAAGICIMLAADALTPYLPTIDVSQVKRSIRHSSFRLDAGLREHPWHHWVVDRLGVYAVLSALIAASMQPVRNKTPDSPAPRPGAASRGLQAAIRCGLETSGRWANAAICAMAFAAACEAAKPFIVGRTGNIANVVMAAAGSVIGAVLGAALAGRLSRPAKLTLAGILLVGYLAYNQWAPFTFVWNTDQARAKIPVRLEWLPLYHYAMGGRLMDAGLFLRTILLSGAVAYVACLSGWWARGNGARRILSAATATGVLGLVLEAGQFFLPPRIPSVTDVFCYAVGGALGCWAYLRGAGVIRTQQPAPNGR